MEALYWTGMRVQDFEGQGLGRAAGLIVDRESGDPLWLLIAHDGEHHRCVPLKGIIAGGGRVTLPMRRDVVMRSPIVPADGGLTARHEHELCEVFNIVPPTRGARLSKWERRRSSSMARVDEASPIGVSWEPPMRGPSTDRRAPGDRRDNEGPVPAHIAERRVLGDRRDVDPNHEHLPEALRGRIIAPPTRG